MNQIIPCFHRHAFASRPGAHAKGFLVGQPTRRQLTCTDAKGYAGWQRSKQMNVGNAVLLKLIRMTLLRIKGRDVCKVLRASESTAVRASEAGTCDRVCE